MSDVIKKYYVGATHIADAIANGGNARCCHADLSDAVNEAKNKIREGADTVIVVEIIRIVRRDTPPITVETV